ncbi:unnamed protein product [Boreogadus saida]
MCRQVVCQACSNNKFSLEYLKNQPARVCDHRFTKLQENRKRSWSQRNANTAILLKITVSKPSQEAIQNEMNIEGVERSFILSASLATGREQWLEAIAKAIDNSTKKNFTVVSSRMLDEAQPDVYRTWFQTSGLRWVPKPPSGPQTMRATVCTMCTCEFTLTWRRDRGRACGKVTAPLLSDPTQQGGSVFNLERWA